MTDSSPFRTHTPAQDFPATYTSEKCHKRTNVSMDECHAFLSNLFRAEQLTKFVQNSGLLLVGSTKSSVAKVSDLLRTHITWTRTPVET